MAQGFDLVSGGTDNHLALIDLRKAGVTGKELQRRLDEVYITANKNAIPNDPEGPFVTSGMRVGTPAVTTRGFREPEMLRIAEFIRRPPTSRTRPIPSARACSKWSPSIRSIKIRFSKDGGTAQVPPSFFVPVFAKTVYLCSFSAIFDRFAKRCCTWILFVVKYD